MSEKVLVTYGSKYGATAEIAEKIAETLKEKNTDVTLLPADEVKGINEYDKVVLGSAIYAGFWRKDLVQVMKNNAGSLSDKKVWVFVSGPTGEGDAEKLMDGRLYPPKLQPIFDEIKPVEIKAFHGAAFTEKMSGMDKWIMKKVKAPMGDFRDWEMIVSWAESIA